MVYFRLFIQATRCFAKGLISSMGKTTSIWLKAAHLIGAKHTLGFCGQVTKYFDWCHFYRNFHPFYKKMRRPPGPVATPPNINIGRIPEDRLKTSRLIQKYYINESSLWVAYCQRRHVKDFSLYQIVSISLLCG